MRLTLATVLTTVYLAFASSQKIMINFKLISTNFQFGQLGTINEIQQSSAEGCALHCINVGCKSFSLSTAQKCTLSNLHVQGKVNYQSSYFVVEDGVKIFSHSDDPLASISIPTMTKVSHTYLAVLEFATWFEALELCPMYGNGFFLVNFDGQAELDGIKDWLINLPDNSPYSQWHGFWTSGTDLNHEACWVWAAPVISRVHGGNWKPGEPSDKNSVEDCMAIAKHYNLVYYDIGCNHKRHFVCKRSNHDNYTTLPSLEQVYNTTIC